METVDHGCQGLQKRKEQGSNENFKAKKSLYKAILVDRFHAFIVLILGKSTDSSGLPSIPLPVITSFRN